MDTQNGTNIGQFRELPRIDLLTGLTLRLRESPLSPDEHLVLGWSSTELGVAEAMEFHLN